MDHELEICRRLAEPRKLSVVVENDFIFIAGLVKNGRIIERATVRGPDPELKQAAISISVNGDEPFDARATRAIHDLEVKLVSGEA